MGSQLITLGIGTPSTVAGFILTGMSPVSPPAATIYYVSNTGSDAANGLTPATAWQTVAKVNAQALIPDDRVRFQCGGTWREQMIISRSGTSGHPIVFESYDVGAQPIFTLSTLLSSGWSNAGSNRWTHALTPVPLQVFFNATRGTVQVSQAAVNAPSEWYWAADVLTVYSTSDPATAFTTPGLGVDQGGLGGNTGAISSYDQDFLTFDGLHCTQSAYGFWSFGPGSFVTFTNCEASWYFYDGFGNGWTDCSVLDCTAHDGRHTGVTSNAARTIVSGGTFYNNAPDEDIVYPGGGGVGFAVGADDCLVENATCYNNLYGVKAFGAVARLTVRRNTCYGNAFFGIDVDTGPIDCVVEYNTVYDNLTHQIAVELSGTDGTIVRYNFVSGSVEAAAGIEILGAINSQVYYNVIDNCGSGIALYSSPQDTVVYNNTITRSIIADINAVFDNADIDGVTLKNNLCTGDGVYVFTADTNTIDNFVSDYNDWYSHVGNKMRIGGVTMGFATWQAITGLDANSQDANPLLTSSSDFQPMANSPCINAGVDVGLTHDIIGVPVTGSPTQGAYEVIGGGGVGQFNPALTLWPRRF